MALQRPEWYFDMDDDKDKAVATRKRILEMAAAERLFVGELPLPVPRHRLDGAGGQGGYRWVPMSYQLNL